jgi:hypothetical protein
MSNSKVFFLFQFIERVVHFEFRDDDLILIHLQRMDHDFYMQRATWKSKQKFKMEDLQRNWGTQHVLSGEKAEQYFVDVPGNISEIPMKFRTKPLF